MEDVRFRQSISKVHPSQKSSTIFNLFFCWALPLFYNRYKNQVTEEEYYKPIKSHESGSLGDRLEKNWMLEVASRRNPSFWKALWRTFRFKFIIFGVIFLFIEFILKMSQPLLIGKLMSIYSNNTNQTIASSHENYLYSSLILLTSFLNVVVAHSYLLGVQHLGMQLRIATCSLIYRKTLKLSKGALAETSTGKIVNLLSNDVNRFDFAAMHFLQLCVVPLEASMVIYLLYTTVGWTSVAGIIFLTAFVPIQMYMGKLTSKFRSKTAAKTDQRVRLMNEIISGIQVIKMYTWEKPFAMMVEQARKLEIDQIRKSSYVKAINVSFMIFVNRTGIFLCVLIYVLAQRKIDAQYVFVVTAFYAILRQTLTVYLPFGINNLSETKVSVERIRKFLLSDEVTTKKSHLNKVEEEEELLRSGAKPLQVFSNFETTTGIVLADVELTWTSSSPILKNINFTAASNELVTIIGAVGSGKTSLLLGILNEISITHGNVEVTGTISYASQEPWLFSGSIRQNVLFGQKFEGEKYQKVVEVCGLQRDFALFLHGDETLVGERGVLLSGGQKARINLARAIYKDADIYLLDDPLSAVDVQVGNEIFQKLIRGYLKEKCTVLVTHQLQHLKAGDKFYLVEKGTVTAAGTYQEILNQKELIQICQDNQPKLEEVTKESAVKEKKKPEEEKEQRNAGDLPRNIYRKYLMWGGNYLSLIILVLLFVLTQTGASGADYFVAFWVNLEQIGVPVFFDIDTCTYIYSSIIIFTILVSVTRSITFFRFCMEASTNLHNNMFSKIVKAPMRFFNNNSSGRILNRFSKDMGLIDELLPGTAMDTCQVAFIVIGIILVIAVVDPWILFPAFAIMVLFYYFRIIFLASSRNLKRLEATARSPVFSHATASMQGLTTVRVLGAQKTLTKEFDHHQNRHSSTFYMFLTCNRAFGFWLDMICFFFSTIVILSIIFKEITAGNVGLGITQAISIMGVFQFGIRQWTELENQMTSVERVIEYTEIVPEIDSEDQKPSRRWPIDGTISFQSVSLRYSLEDNYVLNNVTFEIGAKEKIGIVGRTGAGKTSLIAALFRLVQFEGKISIDNIDIQTISLESLRSKISIIPQDPVLFSGTLRQNLDPFTEYSDGDVWNSLEQVELKNYVADFPEGLSKHVLEGGSNFSVGQKQLLCLARAILRNNKILVLDEATANVDPQTDALIQLAIKKQFWDCTVITIAHRLHTVIESDKVLVMDAGRVVEFGHPNELLKNTSGTFWELVRQTGPQMGEKLISIAEKNHEESKV